MLKGLGKILGADPTRRAIERFTPLVDQIQALEPDMQRLSDDELRDKTEAFRARLAGGEPLEGLIPEAFAAVREASVRTIGLRHFDVQLIGGIVLHEGKIAEMRTGEGKTLVATLPLYLNALPGRGTHLVTVNDYLARRDARWMGPVFDRLGLTVGVLQEAARTENGHKAFLFDPAEESTHEDSHQMRLVDRKAAYAADITYGTNNEFGFDYLRDNMAQSLEARVQRGHAYAIVDEVDNILIDEARTPLIISGPSQEDPRLYEQMARVVKGLNPEDFEVQERDRTIALTEIGEDHVEQLLGTSLRDPERPEDITPEQARLLGHLEQALRAENLFRRNKDYVVQGGRVIIIDEFTGRLMAGRRWSDGLHQAIEAKEGVKIRQDNVTYATITLQNYFRKYEKLAGMTGTAVTEAEEFNKIYTMDVVPLPTNLEYRASLTESDLVEVEDRENGSRITFFARRGDEGRTPIFWRRRDHPDVVFRTEEAKLRAATGEIVRRHVLGQPLLVGTTSVELSERLSGRLRPELLQKLAQILVVRAAYLAAHEIPDDGVRVEELDPLYASMDKLDLTVLRTMARELNLPASVSHPDFLARLATALELEAEHAPALGKILAGGVRHNVLNAKKHDEESRIIADAGALGAVTIATNMAGRGVDIKLGGEIAEEVLAAVNRILRRAGVDQPDALNLEERLARLEGADRESIGIYAPEAELFRSFMENERKVKEAGGLHVLGSERHESRRIDNQLRGRAARQGDAGSSQFFLSLEDELMRLFGGTGVSALMQRLNMDDAVPIAHGMVDRTIEQVQSRVEGANFDTRKHLLEYDDVLNQQREVYYGQRNRVFEKEDLGEDLGQMLDVEVERRVQVSQADEDGGWKLLAWLEETQPTLGGETNDPFPSYLLRLLLEHLADREGGGAVREGLLEIAQGSLAAQGEHLEATVEEQLERASERHVELVRQRLDLADTAVEGAIAEAEESGSPVDPRALLATVEQTAGVRVQMDPSGSEALRRDPTSIRRVLPQLLEASVGLRIWTGMVAWVENRLGESLGLAANPPEGGWEAAAESIRESFHKVWAQKVERSLSELEMELGNALPDGQKVESVQKLRLLLQMSYTQRTLFDRKTHQRRSLLVARLMYPYYAARFLEGLPAETLRQRVLDHLETGQDAIYLAVGKAELLRLGDQEIGSLDETLRTRLSQELGEARLGEVSGRAAVDLREDPDVTRAVGRAALTGAYRSLILSVGDRLWVEYLTQMEALRTSIGLEAYGQRDPLVQYKSRAFDMFQQLLGDIRAGVVSRMFRFQVRSATPGAAGPGTDAPIPSSPINQPAESEGDEAGGKRKRRRRHR